MSYLPPMGTKIGVGIAALALLVGCSNTTTGTGAADDDAGSSGNDGIYGGWVYETANATGATALSFNTDGTYTSIILEEVTASTSQAQEETGTFTVSGNVLTWTPEKFTCPGADPSYETTFGLSEGKLSVTFGSTDLIFVPIPASASSSSGMPGVSSGAEVTLGCFNGTSDSFTAQALEPVGS